MKKLFSILFILFFLPFPLFAGSSYKVLVMGNIIYKPYEQSVLGFMQNCREKVSFFNTYGLRGREIQRRVYQEKPDLVVAIGGDTLSQVRELDGIRVFSLMALPKQSRNRKDAFAGISLEVSPDLQLEVLRYTLPDISSIAILYNPRNTQKFIDAAILSAQKHGLTLFPFRVDSPHRVAESLSEAGEKADLLWMIPDSSVVTPETIETILAYSISSRLPIMTFSKKYTEMGAALSLTPDPEVSGRQAADIVNRMFDGRNEGPSGTYSNNAVITLNLRVLEQLGIKANIEKNNTLQVFK